MGCDGKVSDCNEASEKLLGLPVKNSLEQMFMILSFQKIGSMLWKGL